MINSVSLKSTSFLLTLQYQGTAYAGWQVQHRTNQVTVQSSLNMALTQFAKGQEVGSLAASRTDSGVHAIGQRVKVEFPYALPPKAVIGGVNAHLPPDIRVVEALPCPPDFHPIREAQWKEYRYYFYVGTYQALFHHWWTHVPCRVLDEEKMRSAVESLVGNHCFHNFYCEGTEVKSYHRLIYHAEIVRFCPPPTPSFPPVENSYFLFRIIGKGFLKQMVRLLMGAIWEIGKGRVDLPFFQSALAGDLLPKKRLGPVAPPQGLYLQQVSFASYPEYR